MIFGYDFILLNCAFLFLAKDNLQLFKSDPIVIINEDGPYTPDVGADIIRTVIGVTALAGLRRGEVRGLWGVDDGGDVLSICASIWHSTLKPTNTEQHTDNQRLN